MAIELQEKINLDYKHYTKKLNFVCMPTKKATPDATTYKRPYITNWQNITHTPYDEFKQKETGTAILTGEKSNIIVIDIDVKNNDTGINFMNDNNLKEIGTATAQTPSGGFHFLFKMNEFIKDTLHLFKSHGIDVDILSNGACIISPPTMGYTWIIPPLSLDDIKEMPEALIHELLQYYKDDANKKVKAEKKIKDKEEYNNTNNLIFPFSEYSLYVLTKLLNLLDKNYYDNNKEWNNITICLKSICNTTKSNSDAVIKIWDEWSKQGTSYNKTRNNEIWQCINNAKLSLNITYIFSCINIMYLNYFKNKVKECINNTSINNIINYVKNNKQIQCKTRKIINDKYKEYTEVKALYKTLNYVYKDIDSVVLNNEIKIYSCDDAFMTMSKEFIKACNKYNTIFAKMGTGGGKSTFMINDIIIKLKKSEEVGEVEIDNPLLIELKRGLFFTDKLYHTSNDEKYKKEYDEIKEKIRKTPATIKVMHNNQLPILSIVNRISLADQHINMFNSNKINMTSYNDKSKDIDDMFNISITYDSLHKLDKDKYKGCILVLDEIHSLLNYLHASDTLNNNRQETVNLFYYYLKNAKYIYCLDADITTYDINYICSFRDVKQCIYYVNNHKKYKGREAINYINKQVMINKMIEKIRNKELFICSFDSKKQLNNLITHIKKYIKNDHSILKWFNKNILIYTSKLRNEADIQKEIQNINETWLNKIVFYSPKIITGIDFNPPNMPDIDVFVFAVSTKRKILTPQEVAQQANRNRKINKIHYYIDPYTPKIIYNDLLEVKNYFEDILNNYNSMNKKEIERIHKYCSINYDETELKFNLNDTKFNNMYCQLFYERHIYTSNTLLYFTNILKNKGFKITLNSNVIERDEEEEEEDILKQYDKIIDEQKIQDITNFINNLIDTKEITKCKTMSSDHILKNLISLNLATKNKDTYDVNKDAVKYIDLLINDNKEIEKHFMLNLLFQESKKVNDKFFNKMKQEHSILLCKQQISKIKAVKDIEIQTNINVFEPPTEADKLNKITIDDALLSTMKYLFNLRGKKDKAYTMYDMKDRLIKLYNNISGFKLIDKNIEKTTTDKQRNKIRFYKYEINKDEFNKHINLIKLRNPDLINIDKKVLDIMTTK